ncbi:MAG: hypothetical protein ACMG57_01955 [Candidatus Dojkabacteria bacterium]
METEINKINYDEFGKPNGILILNKPVGITSHDLVDETRKKYKTKKVGHAGTLDPFASGKMIVLLGKATKLSDSFLGMDKEYVAEIGFGVSTNSGDVEGELTETKPVDDAKFEDKLKAMLNSFPTKYLQYVPVFSSVKIQGNKLRELARKADKFEIINKPESEETSKKIIRFYKNDSILFESLLPAKLITLNEIELLSFEEKNLSIFESKLSSKLFSLLKEKNITRLPVAKLRVNCSKGTYIRQLAEDIGTQLGYPAFLLCLERTKIGPY